LNKHLLTIVAFIIAFALNSCQKEESKPEIILSNSLVYYNAINNYYDIALNKHFTSYICRSTITNNTGSIIDKVIVNFEFNNGENVAYAFRNDKFDVFDDELLFEIPIRFESASEFTICFRVITENNIQSNMLTHTLIKPTHAF